MRKIRDNEANCFYLLSLHLYNLENIFDHRKTLARAAKLLTTSESRDEEEKEESNKEDKVKKNAIKEKRQISCK